MERIPAEILNCIFTNLHQLQKTECMLVCRDWYEFIRTQCLLETVVVASELNAIEHLKFLLQQIKEYKMNGQCTRHLLLTNCCDDQLSIDELAMAFPNLRCLYMWRSEFKTPSPSPLTKEEAITSPELSPMAHWLGKLEKIHDCNADTFTIDLFENGYLFNNLVSLSLSSDTIIPFRDLCAHFRNTPVLTTLELSRFEFSLDDFEKLHQNAPLISKLVVTYISIISPASTFTLTNNSIVPNTTMEILEITGDGELFSVQADLARYIGKKYTNLVQLTFQLGNVSERLLPVQETDEYHILAMTLIGALSHQAKSFRVNFGISLKKVLELLSEKGIKQLHNLKFAYSTPHLLDELDYDSYNNGGNSLHTLELCSIDPFAFQMNSDKSTLRNLKTLILSFNEIYGHWNDEWYLETIELNKLLNQCPDQLEQLVIENAEVTAEENNNKCFKQLKSLELVSCVVHREIPKFLSGNCPNIQRLMFIRSELLFEGIDLPQHNIEYLEIDTEIEGYCFVITQNITDDDGNVDDKDGISNNSKTRIYPNPSSGPLSRHHSDDYSLYSGISPIQFDEVKNKFLLYITCRKLQNFIICHRIALSN